ncbi:PAS domain-containing protein [Novosphingobium clariflavum]|uniref:PAS domain-containing protein n=1 Tax=Novosphingobium clariflavum TaxID=2029884 RepID=A0ABV6SDM5_9SPHN|nr:PAS domain-containing protein [Novosphingobium clariflavum]
MNFETLLSGSPNPYIVVDRDLTIAWMNDAYLRATMRERTDLVGRYLFDAFPSEESSDSYKLLRSSLDRVLTTGNLDEIAHIRYDIARPDGVMEPRYWSATHTPQLGSDGEVKFILQHTVDVTELHGLRKLRDEAGLVGRAKAVQARYFDLAREAEWLKEVFDQAPGFIAILDGRDHRFIVANQAFREMFGIAIRSATDCRRSCPLTRRCRSRGRSTTSCAPGFPTSARTFPSIFTSIRTPRTRSAAWTSSVSPFWPQTARRRASSCRGMTFPCRQGRANVSGN